MVEVRNELYLEDLDEIISCNLPWEKLYRKNILVTGATGLIGSCFVDTMIRLGNVNVFAMGRNVEKGRKRFLYCWNNKKFKFICHDISKPFESDIKFDYIIHAASIVNPKGYNEQPVETMVCNFIGTYNLLEYAKNNGINRFMFVSSSEVYGEAFKDGDIFSEEYSGYIDFTKVRSSYPSSKRAAENLLISYSREYGIDGVIVRPSHIYGPTMTEDDSKVIAEFIRCGVKNKDIIVKSSGKQIRDYTYVTDTVSAMLHVLLLGKSNEAYNISSGNIISIKELAELVSTFSKNKIIFENVTDDKETRIILSNKKILELGWGSKVKLEDGISKTIEILKREF